MELGEDLKTKKDRKKITLKFLKYMKNGHNTLMICSGFTTVRTL